MGLRFQKILQMAPSHSKYFCDDCQSVGGVSVKGVPKILQGILEYFVLTFDRFYDNIVMI